MNEAELTWKERTSESALIASVWACNVSEIMSRTALADPCISIILVKDTHSSEIVLRGPETKPRSELLIPGYTWTAIRLQPGVSLKNFPAQEFLDRSLVLPADADGKFWFGGVQLQFPAFHNAELLITRMQSLGLVGGKALDNQEYPKQGLSSKSYSKLVKRTTGLSPYKLHQLQRIYEALHLLKQGMSASAVASELGFVDQAHLNRAAKQFLGHTPKELLGLPQNP
jgi:hypothetical protein